jgi:hypothetical protein
MRPMESNWELMYFDTAFQILFTARRPRRKWRTLKMRIEIFGDNRPVKFLSNRQCVLPFAIRTAGISALFQ